MTKSSITALIAIVGTALGATAQEKRSPELQVLDRFVGTWDHEVTTRTPDGETTRKHVDLRKWSPGGKVLILENSPDKKANPDDPEFYMIITYDPEKKEYPACFLSGSHRGLLTGTWVEKTTTMHWKGRDADGDNKSTGKHHFIGKDRAELSIRVTNPAGEFVVEFSYKQTLRKAAPPDGARPGAP